MPPSRPATAAADRLAVVMTCPHCGERAEVTSRIAFSRFEERHSRSCAGYPRPDDAALDRFLDLPPY